MFKLPKWISGSSNNKANICLDRKTLYKKILLDIKANVDFNSANLLILNKAADKLENAAQYGNNCNLIKTMNFKMGHGLSAWLAQKKRIVCLPDIHRGARHMHNPIRSFVAVPIMFDEIVIGMLNLAHIKPNAFGAEQVKILSRIVEAIAPQLNEVINPPLPQGDTSVERHDFAH